MRSLLVVCSLVFFSVVLLSFSRPTNVAAQINTYNACVRQPVDVAIVIDFSGSMIYSASTGQFVNKLADARTAAKQLARDLFAPNDGAVKVGLVSFGACDNSAQTSIRVPLSGESGLGAINSSIDGLTMTEQESSTHSTCTHQGVQLTNTLLTSSAMGARSNVKKLTVFLTDGVPNAKGLTYEQAVQETLKAVNSGVGSKISYVTIGLGDRTGVELDETLLQCMSGVGNVPSYYGQSCLLNRSASGSYWFAPTSDNLSAIYKSIAGDIGNSCVSPTPTPKPTATPLASINSSIQTDPSLTGGEPPKLIGGLLNPYCNSGSSGSPYAAGSISATDGSGKVYSGNVGVSGNYSITKLPNAENAYCINFKPTDPNIVCTCPVGCQYCGKSAPTTQDLKFYVSPVGNAWYQTVGGEVGAQTASGLALSNPISPTCVQPFCSPFLSLPLPNAPDSTGSLITSIASTVNLLSGAVGNAPNNRHVKVSTPLQCTENYNYFYRLYSMGLHPESDFSTPNDAIKPTGTPINKTAAYYYAGSLPLTISQPWALSGNESIVVFVNGDLHIDNTLTVPPGAFLSFIVSGSIEISPTVGTTDHSSHTDGQVQGVFIANQAIRVKGTMTDEKKLVAEGTFAACNGIKIDRDFVHSGAGLDNNKYPAAIFLYRPDFVKNAPDRMKTSTYDWAEVTP